MSLMTDRRDALRLKVEQILQNIDMDYRVKDRFDKETLITTTRNNRINVMGEGTTYAEVLYEPSEATGGSAGATWTNKFNQFLVRCWYGYSDTSQIVWDRITEGDDGLLAGLEQTSTLQKDGTTFTLLNPTGPIQMIRFLDGEAKELAHYIEFSIRVR